MSFDNPNEGVNAISQRKPRSDSVTAEEVEQAVSRIEARGEKVTFTLLRSEIGHGSMTTLAKLLYDLQLRRAQTQKLLYDGSEETRQKVAALTEKIVEMAFSGNMSAATAKVNTIEKAMISLNADHANLMNEVCAKCDDLERQLNEARAEVQSKNGKVTYLQKELDQKNQENLQLRVLYDERTKEIAALKDERHKASVTELKDSITSAVTAAVLV